jgi:hypothetical protein
MRNPTPEDIYLSKIADLELALDAAVILFEQQEKEIKQLQEENKILIDAQEYGRDFR